ncbi:MAG TPA: Gfo/Idh/MocA family oxidoreductase, partial [Terriglobia bacterium]|nr:Gfo/Idh/MocA family oxidoreductase [Terriglobia bacterium]
MKRREFIRQIAGTGAIASATALSAKRISGANERINLGLIGCGGRGRYDSRLMRQVPNVDFTAVCDVYETHAASAKAWAGPQCRAYKDFRKLLEQKDVDAVVI